ncbi:hypothetical protein RFI_09712, partial [Reticulomyxa filosa]
KKKKKNPTKTDEEGIEANDWGDKKKLEREQMSDDNTENGNKSKSKSKSKSKTKSRNTKKNTGTNNTSNKTKNEHHEATRSSTVAASKRSDTISDTHSDTKTTKVTHRTFETLSISVTSEDGTVFTLVDRSSNPLLPLAAENEEESEQDQ